MLSLKGAQEILPLSVANLGRFPIRNGLKHARRCPRIDAQGKSHSHSIVPSDDNMLIYPHNSFHHTAKNRLADPSKI